MTATAIFNPALIGAVMPWDDPNNPPRGAVVITNHEGGGASVEVVIPVIGGCMWLDTGVWIGCN